MEVWPAGVAALLGVYKRLTRSQNQTKCRDSLYSYYTLLAFVERLISSPVGSRSLTLGTVVPPLSGWRDLNSAISHFTC